MSNHRIKLIALFSAIACYFAPAAIAQTSGTSATDQPATATSSSVPASSSDASASQDYSTSGSRQSPQSSDYSTSGTGANQESMGTSQQSTTQQSMGTGRQSTGADYSTSTSSATSPSTSSTYSSDVDVSTSAGYAAASFGSDSVQRAPDDVDDRKFGKFKGKTLRGSGGEDLGKINDFVVDTQSGEISGIVVSTGGIFGLGDKLRVIEHSKLQSTSVTADELTVQMDKQSFEALQVVTEKQLDSGQFSVTASSSTAGGQSSQAASSQSTTSTSSDQFASSSTAAGQHVLVSKFNDKEIHAGENEVGEIEDIIIDLEQGRAMALVDVEDDFAGTDGKFLIPLSKLQFSSEDDDRVTTTLSRSEFVSGASAGMASSSVLAPTGRDTTSSTSSDLSTTGTTSSSTYGSSQTGSSSVAGTSSTDSSSSMDSPAPDSDRSMASTSSSDTSTGYGSTATTGRESSSSTVAGSSTGSAGTSTDDTSSRDMTSIGGTYDSSTGASSRDSSMASGSATTSSSQDIGSSPADRSSDRSQSVAGSSSTEDENLSATGVRSSDQSPSANPSLVSASTKIRSALDEDSSLAREEVRVTPQGDKIVLQGTVSSEQAKNKAEELAKKNAGQAEIENKLEVKRN